MGFIWGMTECVGYICFLVDFRVVDAHSEVEGKRARKGCEAGRDGGGGGKGEDVCRIYW